LFAYKLALELGMTVEDLLNNMSTIEFKGWIHYFEFVADQQRKMNKK